MINVHVKDQVFGIETGSSTQKLKWLANVAVFRYEWANDCKVTPPKVIRLENGAF